MSKTKHCTQCGATLSETDARIFDGEALCPDCFDDRTTVCDSCGVRIWTDDCCGEGSVRLCEDCFESHYNRCHNCGHLIHETDTHFDSQDHPYCHICYQDRYGSIHEYDYRPEPIFFGSDAPIRGARCPLYLGVELEVDEGGEYKENAEDLLRIANCGQKRLYIKHDGSLEDGFELVSHPMTLSYHQQQMPWKALLDRAQELGYRSHQTDTCGLHVHVSRKALGSSEEEIEQAVGRVVYFVEAHWKELLRFSRRSEEALSRWAARYGLKDTARQTYDGAKKKTVSRYVCVNLLNYDTIELRIFRGTLRYETFLATLQLAEEICHLAAVMDDAAFEAMTWSAFVAGIGREKQELIDYLKQKRLYINEAVAEAEEV